MHLPGYYATNPKALRIRELIRMFGWRQLPVMYFCSRSMPLGSPSWMPGLWGDGECTRNDLSKRFWEITLEEREEFHRLGFTECGFFKVTRHLNPTYQDSGSIKYLDESRIYFAQLLYARVRAQAPIGTDREEIVTAFTVAFDKGNLSYTNGKNSFNPHPDQRVVRLPKCKIEPMHRLLREYIRRKSIEPKKFQDLEHLKKWFNENQEKVFQERVQRGLFLRLNDEQVEAVRRRMPPPLEQ
jgi:hypothetical protein